MSEESGRVRLREAIGSRWKSLMMAFALYFMSSVLGEW
jgi:hypothetical protein